MPKEVSISPNNQGASINLLKKRKRSDSQRNTIKDILGGSPHTKPGDNHRFEKSPEVSVKIAKVESRIKPRTISEMYSFPKQNATLPPHAQVIDLTMEPSTPSPPRKLPMPSIVHRQSGVRKLLIKNQRPSVNSTKAFYERTVEKLDHGLDVIISENCTTALSLEELYQSVSTACKQGYSNQLFNHLISRMKKHATEEIKPRLLQIVAHENSNVLKLRSIIQQWNSWNQKWSKIKSVYVYMNAGPKSLLDTATELFMSTVMKSNEILNTAIQATLELVDQDRKSLDSDSDLIKASSQFFMHLGIYFSDFEPKLRSESQEYFSHWAKVKASSLDLAQYVKSVNDLCELELRRCDVVEFTKSTKRILTTLLDDLVIRDQAERLTREEDVSELLYENDVTGLADLYKILLRRNLTNNLIKSFANWIKKAGHNIVFDEEHEDEMVVRLLALQKQTDRMFTDAFQKNKDFFHPMRDTFTAVVNKTNKQATHGTDNTKQGEMIAKYVDLLLRGGHKSIPSSVSRSAMEVDGKEEDNEVEDTDAIMEDQLDQVLDLFRYLEGKTVFEAFYKKDLARRLLMGRSASSDAEVSMLMKLRNECGENFTTNLEIMFRDIELSKEEMAPYRSKYVEGDNAFPVELHVNVLAQSAWPSYPDVKLNVPSEVQETLNKFEESYKNRHSNRKLAWKHALAHCQLKASFPKGKKELIVSGFQGVVLLLFNKRDLLSYKEILAETGLSAQDLKRTLQSLACAKYKPLRKEPHSREIGEEDTFTVNKNFSHPRVRIKINQVQLKETKQENKETHEQVRLDRELETQAAIVRIMKGKQRLSHNELVTEVITVTRKRGVLEMSVLKKQIEKMIDKEYIEREDGPGNMYAYVA